MIQIYDPFPISIHPLPVGWSGIVLSAECVHEGQIISNITNLG